VFLIAFIARVIIIKLLSETMADKQDITADETAVLRAKLRFAQVGDLLLAARLNNYIYFCNRF
jgi:hypothetical protein